MSVNISKPSLSGRQLSQRAATVLNFNRLQHLQYNTTDTFVL